MRVMTKTALRTTQELLDDQPGLDPKTIFVSVAMVVIEEWIDQWSAAEAPAKKTTSKKAPAKKSAPRKAPAKKAAAKKVAAKSAPAIGSNPKRRHGSAGSRALAP